jgi:hypothetical protein
MSTSANGKQRSLGWLKNVAAIAAVVTTGVGTIAPIPSAQADDELQTLEEAFMDAFYENDKNFYRNRSVFRQVQNLFFTYPENEIAEDGQAIHELYMDAMRQQTSSDPTIRTPDLYNPFDRSLLSDPDLQGVNAPSQNQLIWRDPAR